MDNNTPIAIGSLSREEINAELQNGIDSINKDRAYSTDEVDAFVESLFGIIPDTMTLEQAIEERRNEI